MSYDINWHNNKLLDTEMVATKHESYFNITGTIWTSQDRYVYWFDGISRPFFIENIIYDYNNKYKIDYRIVKELYFQDIDTHCCDIDTYLHLILRCLNLKKLYITCK
jgi:hypothetical protein